MAITYPLSAPTVVAPRKTTFLMDTATSDSTSQFSFEQQIHAHSGQRWRVSAELPPMIRAEADEWEAFLLQLDGPYGTFLFGDYGRTALRGVATACTVDGGSQTGNELAVTSLAVSTNDVFKAGDWIQLPNYRLHRVVKDADSDSNGDAILDIWPSLRESPSDTDEIIIASAVGRFRLQSSRMTVSETIAPQSDRFTLSFSAIEVV